MDSGARRESSTLENVHGHSCSLDAGLQNTLVSPPTALASEQLCRHILSASLEHTVSRPIIRQAEVLLQSQGIRATMVSLNSFIFSCERSQRWDWALQMLRPGLVSEYVLVNCKVCVCFDLLRGCVRGSACACLRVCVCVRERERVCVCELP